MHRFSRIVLAIHMGSFLQTKDLLVHSPYDREIRVFSMDLQGKTVLFNWARLLFFTIDTWILADMRTSSTLLADDRFVLGSSIQIHLYSWKLTERSEVNVWNVA